jgi:Restriction endonuclease BamHI
MKIVERKVLSNEKGSQLLFDIQLIKELETILESTILKINPTRKGNGVLPLKQKIAANLKKNGWILEHKLTLADMKSGPIDAFKVSPKTNIRIGFEWETGNISSSFRAIMKLFKAVIENEIDHGILALPSKQLYQYLTDRVGNIDELKPYFSIFSSIKCPAGKYVAIVALEYDEVNKSFPIVAKGLDGMSLKRRQKQA